MKLRPSHLFPRLTWTSLAGATANGGRRGSLAPTMAPTALSGYLLVEALVYIAVVFVLLGAGYAAMYRCIDSSLALRRNVDGITSALHAGERWRADVRSATNDVHLESLNGEQFLRLAGPKGTVVYRYATNTVFRSVGGGPWTRLLSDVKASAMEADPRDYVTAWRWELELATRAQASVKPSRIRPLFTFIGVPERHSTK